MMTMMTMMTYKDKASMNSNSNNTNENMNKKNGRKGNNNNNNCSNNFPSPSPTVLLLLLFLLMVGIARIPKKSNYLSQYSEIMSIEQKIEYTMMTDDNKTEGDSNSNNNNGDGDDNDKYVDYNVATTTPNVNAKTNSTNAETKTDKKQQQQHQHHVVSPRNMDIKYYEMWNHNTSTIDVPDKYKFPFYDGIPSSLEILESVLHGEKNEKEYMDVDNYMTSLSLSNSDKVLSLPNCLAPDTRKTRQIANEILDGTRSRLSLPILNVGYPKVGSSTLHEYFNCIGIRSNHGQIGPKMMEMLSQKKNLSAKFPRKMAYMQMDSNFHSGYYPQIQLLDELHEAYGSHSTLIINFRPIQDFIRSISSWNGLKSRMRLMEIPGLILSEEQFENNEQIKNQRIKDATAILLLHEKFISNTTLNTANMTKSEKNTYDRAAKLLQKNDKSAVAKILTKAAKTVAESEVTSNTTSNNNNNNNNKRRRKLKHNPLTDQQISRWWCGHIKHIREYVKLYTNHTLIELDLYNTKETSKVLYDIFHSSSSTTTSTISTSSQNENEKEKQNNNNTYEDVNNAGGTANLEISTNESCWGQSNVNKRLKKKKLVLEREQERSDVIQANRQIHQNIIYMYTIKFYITFFIVSYVLYRIESNYSVLYSATRLDYIV